MDNVLIDDRRIHVDFSQSVAKLVYNKPGEYHGGGRGMYSPGHPAQKDLPKRRKSLEFLDTRLPVLEY
jgi:hypothetical protein